ARLPMPFGSDRASRVAILSRWGIHGGHHLSGDRLHCQFTSWLRNEVQSLWQHRFSYFWRQVGLSTVWRDSGYRGRVRPFGIQPTIVDPHPHTGKMIMVQRLRAAGIRTSTVNSSGDSAFAVRPSTNLRRSSVAPLLAPRPIRSVAYSA